ncbi:MAG: hypothetical protein ABSB76_37910 [Streptosporangiaceae bacterium]|jgi:hypothetical protein
MNNKRGQMVADLAAPHLRPDEQIVMTVYANVGSVSVKRVIATAAVVTVATAGMFTAFARPRKTYLALTSQRLMFFNGETVSGRPGKLLFSLPREAVSVADVDKGVINVKVELAIEGQDKGLRLTFPTVARKDGEQVAAVLRSTVAV